MDAMLETSDPHERAAQLIPWLVNGTLGADDAAWVRAHLESCAPCRTDFDAERRLYEAIRADGPRVLSGEPSLERLLARIEADEFAADAAAEAAEGNGADAAPQPTELGMPARERGMSAAAAEPTEAAPSARTRRSGVRRRLGWRRVDRRAGQRAVWRAPAARWLTAAVMVEALALGLVAWAWHAGGARDSVVYPAQLAAISRNAAPYGTLTTPAPRYGAGARVRIVFRSELSVEQLQRLLRSVGAHIVDGPTDARVFTLGFAEPVSHDVLDARIAKLRADPDVLLAEPAEGRPP